MPEARARKAAARPSAVARKAVAVVEPPVEAQVLELLHGLRAEVTGVLGCLVATSDGLLVAADAPELEAAQLAALTSTMTALARHAVEATRRGELLDATVRGTHGHLAVFAISDVAVLAVIAHPDVASAWLNVKTRPVVAQLITLSPRFQRFHAIPPPEPPPPTPTPTPR